MSGGILIIAFSAGGICGGPGRQEKIKNTGKRSCIRRGKVVI